jgi:hypothetical protein
MNDRLTEGSASAERHNIATPLFPSSLSVRCSAMGNLSRESSSGSVTHAVRLHLLSTPPGASVER